MKQLVSGGGRVEFSFITQRKNVAEETNDNADVNSESNKGDYNKKYMVVKTK